MPRRRQFSNQQLLDQLAASCQRAGRSVTEKEFDEDPETTVAGITIRKRFHGWNEALSEIGMEPTKHGRKPMGKEPIIVQLQACRDQLGRVPTGAEFCEITGLSMGTIYRAFKTWNKALAEAKLTESERGLNQRYSDEDLLLQLATVIARDGAEPSFEEFSAEPDTVSAQAMVDRFGTWAQAKLQAHKYRIDNRIGFTVIEGGNESEQQTEDDAAAVA